MSTARRLLKWSCRRCPAAGWAYSLAEVRAHVDGHPAPRWVGDPYDYDTTTYTRLSLLGTGR